MDRLSFVYYVTQTDLLSSLNCFNVNGINAISMDSVHISVGIQLQAEDPLERERSLGLLSESHIL